MKTLTLFGIGLAVTLSCAAWADEALDPAALGGIDGMLASCLQVNPAGKSGYDALRAVVTGNQTAAAIDAAAQTPEYREAYDAAHQKGDAQPRDVALKECANLAASLGARSHQRHRPNAKSKPSAAPSAAQVK